MKIENLNELQKLIQLCRKTGIEAFEIGDIKFNLGPAPLKRQVSKLEQDFLEADLKIPQFNANLNVTAVVEDKIKTDGLTEEQLLFYSARTELTGES